MLPNWFHKITVSRARWRSFGAMIATVACLAMVVPPVGAQDYGPVPNAYQIDDVAVDVTASTAAIARDIAIRHGQRRALDMLIKRLTIAEDRQGIPTLDDANVEALVLSIQFKNERYSSTRYISDLTITFNQEGVRRLLDISGSRFSETMARPMLILPYHQNAGLSVAWDDKSTWQTAWSDADWRTSLVPFVLPETDTAITVDLLGTELGAGSIENAALMADLYETSETLTVIARDSVDLFTGASLLEVETIRRGIGDEVRTEYVFEFKPDESGEELFARVAQAIGREIAQEWKVQTLVSLDQLAELQARFYLTSLDDWVKLQKRLRQIPVIKEIVLREISVTKASITLNYLGTPEQLSATLQHYGIVIQPLEQHWVLLLK
jgi:hypothetical protein